MPFRSGTQVRLTVNSIYGILSATRRYGQLVTVYQASEAFGCSRTYLYRLVGCGRLTRISVWGVVMVGLRELKAELTTSQLDSASQAAIANESLQFEPITGAMNAG